VSFFRELLRRNVFRVAGTYAVVAWLLIQVSSAVASPLNLPSWFEAFIIVLLAIGFPVALVLAWAFEITPEGLQLTQSPDGEAPSGGKRMDYVLIGALVLVAGIVVWDHFPSPAADGSDAAKLRENPSIAVLPFEDMSPGGDQEYFGDGIAEELLNVLARLDGLRVAGRTSSFSYRGKDDDLRVIGKALNVKTILEGSVRKDGERIRITAQLINADDGYHIWSDVFDEELTDIFSIQEEIATEVAGALGVRLGVGNVNAFLGAGTKNVEAYEEYLKGWVLWDTHGESIRHLETALQLDPNYAAAWATLGVRTAHMQWAARPGEAPAILDKAYGYVLRAVELDPASGTSLSLLGTILYVRFDWIGGEDAHTRAIRLRPDRWAHEHLGNLLARAGRLAAADREYDRTIAAEPQAGSVTAFNWEVSLGRGMSEEAKQRLTTLYRGKPPEIGLLAIALNDADSEQARALLAIQNPTAVSTRTLFVPVLRDFDSQEAVLGTLRAVLADDGAWWPSKYHDIALLAAHFDDAELALQAFEKDARYMVIRLQALWYPVMSETRRLPAFKDLVRDIKLLEYWRANGWADACQPVGADDFSCE
jgi:TolB-like protein